MPTTTTPALQRGSVKPAGKPPKEEEPLLSDRRAADIARPPRVSINGILVGALGTMILTLLSFTAIHLPNVLAPFYALPAEASYVLYNFQLPFAVFLGAFLGSTLGGGAVLGFILMGLFVLPVFAGGGGVSYVLQPGFGFLLGMYLATWMTGRMIRRVMKAPGPKRLATLFAVALTVVLAAYAVGVLYGFGLFITKNLSWAGLQNVFFHLAAEMLVYDTLAVVVWLSLVRFARLLFWMVLY